MLSNVEKKMLRQEGILESLTKLKFATRSQLQHLHSLGSVRNANRVLKELGSFVNRCRHQETNEWIYYLSEEGCRFIGYEKPYQRNSLVYHTTMRNDMYLYYNCPKDWEYEKAVEFKVQEDLGMGIMKTVNKTIIPDARFTYNGIRHYLEVDNTQSMRENRAKIKLYGELFPIFQTKNKQPFSLVIYTNSSIRQKHLQEELRRTSIPYKIYTKRDIQ